MDESETTNSELVEKKIEPGKTAFELNPCQGYKVDPVSKLHLCNAFCVMLVNIIRGGMREGRGLKGWE